MDFYHAYIEKQANAVTHGLVGAGLGTGVGLAQGLMFPSEPTPGGRDRTPQELSQDLVLGAGIGGTLGAAVAPVLADPEFKKRLVMSKMTEDVKNIGGHLGRAAQAFVKRAAGPFDFLSPAPAESRYDPKLHAAVLRAKAKLSRSRLYYQSAFRKLPPVARNKILEDFDAYHTTVQDSVLSGRYAGPF